MKKKSNYEKDGFPPILAVVSGLSAAISLLIMKKKGENQNGMDSKQKTTKETTENDAISENNGKKKNDKGRTPFIKPFAELQMKLKNDELLPAVEAFVAERVNEEDDEEEEVLRDEDYTCRCGYMQGIKNHLTECPICGTRCLNTHNTGGEFFGDYVKPFSETKMKEFYLAQVHKEYNVHNICDIDLDCQITESMKADRKLLHSLGKILRPGLDLFLQTNEVFYKVLNADKLDEEYKYFPAIFFSEYYNMQLKLFLGEDAERVNEIANENAIVINSLHEMIKSYIIPKYTDKEWFYDKYTHYNKISNEFGGKSYYEMSEAVRNFMDCFNYCGLSIFDEDRVEENAYTFERYYRRDMIDEMLKNTKEITLSDRNTLKHYLEDMIYDLFSPITYFDWLASIGENFIDHDKYKTYWLPEHYPEYRPEDIVEEYTIAIQPILLMPKQIRDISRNQVGIHKSSDFYHKVTESDSSISCYTDVLDMILEEPEKLGYIYYLMFNIRYKILLMQGVLDTTDYTKDILYMMYEVITELTNTKLKYVMINDDKPHNITNELRVIKQTPFMNADLSLQSALNMNTVWNETCIRDSEYINFLETSCKAYRDRYSDWKTRRAVYYDKDALLLLYVSVVREFYAQIFDIKSLQCYSSGEPRLTANELCASFHYLFYPRGKDKFGNKLDGIQNINYLIDHVQGMGDLRMTDPFILMMNTFMHYNHSIVSNQDHPEIYKKYMFEIPSQFNILESVYTRIYSDDAVCAINERIVNDKFIISEYKNSDGHPIRKFLTKICAKKDLREKTKEVSYNDAHSGPITDTSTLLEDINKGIERDIDPD